MEDFNKIRITDTPLESNSSLSIIPIGTENFTLKIRDDKGQLRGLDSSIERYSLQNVSDIGNFTDNSIIIKGSEYYSNISKRINSISSEKDFDNGELNNLVVNGYNTFTSLKGKEELNEPGIWSQRYVAMGTDIFPDFTGDTNYRPNHPAHDSLIGFGSILGKGVKDGTNFSLFGTAVFPVNDIPVWDSVTAMGKGIANAKGIYNDPNRVSVAANGFNLRNMMNNVVALGNEIWCGDIHSSTIVGYNVRNYSYIFNSLVLGGNIYDAQSKYQNETIEPQKLDNDVMIGFGFYKDPKKHPLTHNLLIGAHTHYGNGGPDFNYRPLVEGNFKSQYFGINGKIIARIQDKLNKVPTESLELSLISSPVNSNASYNNITKKLILNNSPGGNYRLFSGLTVGEAYLFTIYSNIGNTGTWGYEIAGLVDTGNGDSWLGTNNHLADVTSLAGSNFDVTLQGSNITGEIYVSMLHVKNDENQIPAFEIQDGYDNVTMECRTSNSEDNHMSFGKNSAPKYASGINNSIFGQNSLIKANSIATTFVFGNNNLEDIKKSRLNVIAGYNVLKNSSNIIDRMVAIGQDIAPNSINLRSSVAIGLYTLQNFKGNFYDNNIWNDIVSIGNFSGLNVEESQRSVFLGTGAGNSKNVTNSVAVGARAYFKDLNVSTNEIVIGTDAKGNGNNTATIGNIDTTSLFVGGNGAGIILTSPDGSKKVKISVDNQGNLLTVIV